MKSLVLAGAFAAIGAVALNAAPAQARVAVGVYATVAPPPLRTEVVPPPRRGFVWVPGYWNWSRRHYVWAPGHYVRARRGYHYAAPRWEQEGNRWRYHEGRWDR